MNQVLVRQISLPKGPASLLRATADGLQQFRGGGTTPMDKKAKDQPFWDTEWLLAGVGEQQITFFNSRTFAPGSAQAGVIKSVTEYNLRDEGQFPAPNDYSCVGLKFRIMADIDDGFGPAVQTIEMLRAFAIMTFRAGDKDWWRWRLDDFSNAGFIGGANAAATGGVVNFGAPGLTDWYEFSIMLPIPTSARFAFVLNTAPEFDIPEDVRVQAEMIGQLVTNVR